MVQLFLCLIANLWTIASKRLHKTWFFRFWKDNHLWSFSLPWQLFKNQIEVIYHRSPEKLIFAMTRFLWLFWPILDRATLISPASRRAGSSGELPRLEMPIGHDDVIKMSIGSEFAAKPFSLVFDPVAVQYNFGVKNWPFSLICALSCTA